MKKWVTPRDGVLFGLLIVLMVIAAKLDPKFVTIRAQTLLSSNIWSLAIVSVPMLLIIMTEGIDLSVGSIVALSGVSMGLVFAKTHSIWMGIATAILVGLLLGWINSWFIARMKVHPLIVTLATMAMFRGIAEGISRGRSISNFPDGFQNFATNVKFGVPYPGFLFFGLVALTWFVLTKTRLGRWIIAIGFEENVSIFSGIPVQRVKFILYSACGIACSLAAIFLIARDNTAKADMGLGLELEAITAVVLGGANIEGGTGSVLGLILGLLLIHESREFVSWHWQQSELSNLIVGVLLIGTLVIENGFSFKKIRQFKWLMAQSD